MIPNCLLRRPGKYGIIQPLVEAPFKSGHKNFRYLRLDSSLFKITSSMGLGHMETHGADTAVTIVGSEPQTPPSSNLQHPGPTVFIVSDMRLLRDGLVLSLSRQPSLAVADSADLTISPTHIAAARPDVVLLDVGTP